MRRPSILKEGNQTARKSKRKSILKTKLVNNSELQFKYDELQVQFEHYKALKEEQIEELTDRIQRYKILESKMANSGENLKRYKLMENMIDQ